MTIDVWIGEITISISIGANILVAGPKFHGERDVRRRPRRPHRRVRRRASRPRSRPLPWDEFVRKYLEEAAPGVARVRHRGPGQGRAAAGHRPGRRDRHRHRRRLARPSRSRCSPSSSSWSRRRCRTGRIDLGGADAPAYPERSARHRADERRRRGHPLHLNLVGADGDRTAAFKRELAPRAGFPARRVGPAAARRRPQGARRATSSTPSTASASGPRPTSRQGSRRSTTAASRPALASRCRS